MNRVAKRAKILVLLVLALAIGLTAFGMDYLQNAQTWALHPGSPHVYYATNIGCGLITDRTDALLLDLSDGRAYSVSELLRRSTVHWVGDRGGNIQADMLSHYAQELAGFDLINGVYAYGGVGGTAKLTLSALLQMTALEAMGDYTGTVAVFNYQTGEILCAVTTPNFDPDNLPEDLEEQSGIYVNRFLKGLYTPGSIFKIVTAAAALEQIPDIMDQSFTCTGSLEFGTDKVTCERAHGDMTFREAFANSCNCAFGRIALQVDLESAVKRYGLLDSVSFDGVCSNPCSLLVQDQADVQIAWSGIGQHKDLINPCAYLTFIGAIANGGVVTNPYLVSEITADASTTYRAEQTTADRIISEETAAILQDFMRNNVANYYGEDAFHGFTVCAKSGTAEVGGTKKPNAMFTGFVQDDNCPLAFLVAIEDGGYGKQVCLPILDKIFSVIRENLDTIR